jgi:hypothetical protein
MVENSTFLVGVLSILQMLVLPGLLVVRYLSAPMTHLHRLLVVVVLSFIINFWLVLVLTLCGAYNTSMVRSVMGLEVLGLFWAYRAWFAEHVSFKACGSFWLVLHQSLTQKSEPVRWYYRLVFWLGVFTLGYFVLIWLQSLGWTFSPWDPAVSWNPWALQWAQGHLPEFTYHYPQLLPANWSISYVLLGSLDGTLQAEAFPHAVMGCFPLVMLLSLVVLYQHTRQSGYWLALTLTGATLWLLMRAYFNLGYADIAAASLAFFALTQLVLAGEKLSTASTYLWLGTVAVAAAALTKQVALILAVLYPILSWLIAWRHQQDTRRAIMLVLLQWLVLIVLVLPWYGIAQWMIHAGMNGSEIHYVSHTIYRHTGWQERLLLGWHFASGWYWLMFVVLVVLGWQVKSWRAIFWWIGVPTTLIWLTWFDYDSRNLTLAMPIVCTAFALLWQQWAQKGWLAHALIFLADNGKRVRYYEVLVLVLMALAMLGFMAGFQVRDIAHDQAVQKRHIANKSLDKTLYEYIGKYPLEGKILTAWPFLSQMPVLAQYVQHLDHRWYGADMLPDTFQDVSTFKAALRAFPQVKYILSYNLYPMMGPAVKQYLSEQVKAGRFKILWTVSAFTFYQIQ